MKAFLKKSVFVAGLIVLSSPFISCNNSEIKKENEFIKVADNIFPLEEEIKVNVVSRKPIVFIAGFDKGNETFYSNARSYFQKKGLKVIDGQYSLEEIIVWLNDNENKNPYGEVHIVNKSNPYKGMNLETIVRGEKITSETLRKCITQGTLPTLKDVVNNELKNSNISKDKAYLEPSFFSNEYGVQGRLDLFHIDEENKQSDIVELKSGKLFKPNGYGLNENHYVQTLLYDLIIESNYKAKVKSNNYILYSALDSKRLKYAPRVRNKQYEAIKVRNDIVLLENLLCKIDEEAQPDEDEEFPVDAVPGRVGADRVGEPQRVEHRNDRDQSRVLEDADEGGDDAGDRDLQRLGQNDQLHRLPIVQAQRIRALVLALVHRQYRSLYQFGIIDSKVQSQPDDASDKCRQINANLNKPEIDQE